MFQPHLFFKNSSKYSKIRKLSEKYIIKDSFKISLIKDKENNIFHQDPEKRVSATFFPCIPTVTGLFKKINLKNAPKPLSCSLINKTRKETMERNSYATYSVGKGKEYSFEFKQEAVFAAQELGVKPAARKFKIAVNTMRSWLKKFKDDGKRGLEDRRCGPYHVWNKTPPDIEEKVISIRNLIPCYGPNRIKYYFGIDCSLGAIQRIIRSAGLTRRRRKAHQKKRDLREVKARRKSMQHLQMDVKHLYDIPNYWEQLQEMNLPKYQYTIRDTKSGMLFLGFSNELSELNARTMVDHVLDEMKPFLPFDIQELTIQTDNGSEFSGNARRIENGPFPLFHRENT